MKPQQPAFASRATRMHGLRGALCLLVALATNGIPATAVAANDGVYVVKKIKEIQATIGDGTDIKKARKKLDEDETKLTIPPSNSSTRSGITPSGTQSTALFDIKMKREQLTIIEQTGRLAADRLAAAARASNAAMQQVLLNEAEGLADSAAHLRARVDGSVHQTSSDTPSTVGTGSAAYEKSCEGIFACAQLRRVFELGQQGGSAFDASLKEPGGIKFDQLRADGLSLALQVDAVDYDPVRGQITLIGRKSAYSSDQRFDLDVFADILRLAVEKYEPFFSLDPTVIKDWDEEGIRAQELLQQRYGSAMAVAARIRAVNPDYIQHGATQYFYATLDAAAPDIAAQVNRGRDVSVKLIFSPRWLRNSKVGWMLFKADLTIKSIAAGFSMFDKAISPSPAWQFSDFDPIWTQIDQGAGRANFELDESSVAQTGTRLDLSGIRPKLFVTERTPNTREDLQPSKYDRALADHFRLHWNDYVARLPEIANLDMIYRAYVAARYLVRDHPGLAARILMMPREPTTKEAPLRMVQPLVLRTASRDGHLVSLEEGANRYYDISGGYGGGTAFKVDHNVTRQTVKSTRTEWIGNVRRAASADASWFENGDQAAAVLDFVTVSMPVRWSVFLAAALTIGVVGAAFAGVFLHQYPWQRLRAARTCVPCARTHTRLGRGALIGDVLAAASLLYLATLPLVAAAFEWPSASIYEVVPAIVFVAGVLAGCIVLGVGGQALVAALLRGDRNAPSLFDAFFSGGRIALIGLGAVALLLFISGADSRNSWLAWLPSEATERLLLVVGGVSPLVIAVVVGASGTVLSVFLRWAAPYFLESRPLPLLPAGPHFHAASLMERR
jgi:hypothetical protein